MASLQTRFSDLITAIGTQFKSVRTLISGSGTGDVSGLNTTATNLVAAINEVKSTADSAGGGSMDDVVDDTSPQLGGDLDTNSNHIQFDDAHGIQDDSGNELLTFSKTASAVNEITIANAATGSGPTISATGGDTNIDLLLAGKGTGVPKIGSDAILTAGDIGSSVQAQDAQLDSLSSASANGVSLVTAANYAAMRGLLDLEAGTDFYSISATDSAISTAIDNLVASAPGALDTLNELAASLGDDANFAGTMTTALAAKAATADIYTRTELGDPDTNLVTLFNAAIA